jgi:hypothetical protein
MNDKIKEWKDLLLMGLNNGLTQTIQDGRTNDINWVRKRLELFESFTRCVVILESGLSYEYDEKSLREVAEEGYKKDLPKTIGLLEKWKNKKITKPSKVRFEK